MHTEYFAPELANKKHKTLAPLGQRMKARSFMWWVLNTAYYLLLGVSEETLFLILLIYLVIQKVFIEQMHILLEAHTYGRLPPVPDFPFYPG